MGKRGMYVVWTLSLLLGLMFVLTGAMKLINADRMAIQFSVWGYQDWFVYVIGVVELICGGLLMVPGAAIFAGSLLSADMIGAVITLIVHHDSVGATAPLVILILLAIIMRMRLLRKQLKPQLGDRHGQ
jgi:uncharacterized membrane protein YphA (DoxX/SURF4 family)